MGALDYSQKPKHYIGPGLFEPGKPAWNRGTKNTAEHIEKARDAEDEIRIRKELEGEYRLWHDKGWLENEYWGEGRSFQDIGKEYGICPKKLKQWARRHGVRTRNRSEAVLNAYKFGKPSSPVGENSHHWKGGRGVSSGYHWVSVGGGKIKFEHVLIAEKALGRPLKKGECVHHINMDKTDNRATNLLICDHAYHKWLHWRMEVEYAKEHLGGRGFKWEA